MLILGMKIYIGKFSSFNVKVKLSLCLTEFHTIKTYPQIIGFYS